MSLLSSLPSSSFLYFLTILPFLLPSLHYFLHICFRITELKLLNFPCAVAVGEEAAAAAPAPAAAAAASAAAAAGAGAGAAAGAATAAVIVAVVVAVVVAVIVAVVVAVVPRVVGVVGVVGEKAGAIALRSGR